jgi:amino acid adenylation domain-containing protein
MRISDFKLVARADDRAALKTTLAGFNRTAVPFDRDRLLPDLLAEAAARTPDAVAVESDGRAWTYAALTARADAMAQFIAGLALPAPRAVGVLTENTAEMLAAILGILKAGCVYLPLNPDLPVDRLRFMLSDAEAGLLVFEKRFVREANRLQWECPALLHGLCVDSDTPAAEPEPLSELMRDDLWAYVGEEASDDITGGGWLSSYDGQPLSRAVMDDYAANVDAKVRPLLTPRTRVLEIGCSTGITLFRLAPHCGHYTGVDLSPAILRHTEAERARRGLSNVTLHALPAHAIDRLAHEAQAAGGYDVVIINSVIQNLNGHNYVRDVLRKAVSLMAPRGHVFLGDLMDQDGKQALIDELTAFKQANPDPAVKTKLDWSHELFIARGFLDDLRFDVPGVTAATHSDKIASVRSELSAFRFDTVLTIDKTAAPTPEADRRRHLHGMSAPDRAPDAPPAPITAEDAAYIIYTSGTTGRPKGVAVSHRSFHNYMRWAARTYFQGYGGGSMALFTSPAFDLTLTSIFVPLFLGRTVHCLRADDVDRQLAALFRPDTAIDGVKLTPSHITILGQLEPEPVPGIRVAIVGGEELTETQVATLKRICPNVTVYNEYGPTEATVGCTIAVADAPPIHIGTPIDNTEILILGTGDDTDFKPVGVPGELCVAGDGVAIGYWNRPELTAEKFRPHPDDPARRLYRTGDLAKWTPEGHLVLLGRADHQVKIRGNRIETGEIESQLRRLPDVADALVTAHTAPDGDKVLCAYVVGRRDVPLEAIRAHLAVVFPDFMIPSHVVCLREFPLSPNGKIDRKRLPAPDAMVRARAAAYVAPATASERALATVWAEVLGVDQVGRDDDFFALGGHSLKATQVVSRVHKRLGLDLSLRDVFGHPTLRAQAAVLADRDRRAATVITPVPPALDHDVSHSQRRLWVLHQLEDAPVAYTIHEAVVLSGPLDIDRLRTAFARLTARHETLRTSFHRVGGEPRQRIHDAEALALPVTVTDLSTAPDPVAAARALSRKDAATPFDLTRAPLWRATVARLGPDRHALLFSIHHIVSDGWSGQVMIAELTALYDGAELPPLPVQYKDFAAWQNRRVAAAGDHRAYWLDAMAGGGPEPLDLPTDFPRPAVKGFGGALAPHVIPAPLARALHRLARARGASLFMVLTAGVKALLHRWTGQDDIAVGSPVAGRTHEDLEHQIGFFVNTLVLRDRVNGATGFAALLDSVRATATDAFEHQIYPFDSLVDALNLPRDTSRSPLFDVMVVLQDNAAPPPLGTDLTVESLEEAAAVSRFDLTFHFADDTASGEILCGLEYSTELFRADTAARLWRLLTTLLDAATADPDAPLSTLPLLSADETQAITARFVPGPAAPVPDLLAPFAHWVAEHPERPALVAEGRTLSYAALDAASDALAADIAAVAEAGAPVAVLLPRGRYGLVAFLAVLKAGCAAMALDPAYPADRLELMIADAQAAALLVTPDTAALCPGAAVPVIDVTTTAAPAAPFRPRRGTGPAYVVYTSGSTGRPKGVAGTADCLANLVAWQRGVIGDGLRQAQFAQAGFDVAVQEMLYAVSSGGTLFVPAEDDRRDPARLTGFVADHGLDLITLPYSALQILFAAPDAAPRLASLKHIITSGEQPRVTGALKSFLEARPDVVLHNQYGPSETHVVTAHSLSAATGSLEAQPPIGRPIANVRAHILGPDGRPAPVGVPGELVIGGVAVAPGYIGAAAAETAARFVPEPGGEGRAYRTGDRCRWRADGTIAYLGRADDQVKIRGHRVETGEVETVLEARPEVAAAAVVARVVAGQAELAAYVTAADPAAPPVASALRATLARTLPDVMIPATITVLDALPRTASGKLNRRALPAPAVTVETTPAVPPATSTEATLLGLWETVLGRSGFGADAAFFALGGNSLRAVQLIVRVQEAFGVDMPLLAVFQSPALRDQARWIDERRAYADRHEARVMLELSGGDGPRLFALPPVLGYGSVFAPLAEAVGAPVTALDFIEADDPLPAYAAALAEAQPDGPLRLFGYSGGGNLGFELTKHLEAQGRTVEALILLDTFRLDRTYHTPDDERRDAIERNLDYFADHIRQDADTRMLVDNPAIRALLVRRMDAFLRWLDSVDNRGSVRADIHLIEAADHTGDPRRAAWSTATTGRFIAHAGAGPHVDMLMPAHLEANAAVLRHILDTVAQASAEVPS